jgi:D-3-phosphoglycerate dehydrogenase
MKIVVIDDYQNAFKTLKSYPKLSGHEVVVYTDTEKDAAKLAERLKDAEVVVLTQQRSAFPRAVIEKLPKLKLIGQTGRAATHVDLEACTEKGIIVSAGGSCNSNATAELTWGLILSALRSLPYEVKRLKKAVAVDPWHGINGKTLGIYAYGKSAVSSPASAERSAHGLSVGVAKARPAAPKPPALKSPRAGRIFSPRRIS